MNTAPLFAFRNVTKRFPGVVASRDVSLSFSSGKVHALLGENGAGKSTLVRMMSGIYQPDDGEIRIDGVARRIRSPREAEEHGIVVVHQHRTLVEELSVAENLFIGRLGAGWRPFSLRRVAARSRELLDAVGLDVDPRALVSELSPASQQLLEIARALGRNARLIVLDEPTTSLTPLEREVLFARIRELRERGLATVYISHDLEDALALSDEVTVLRDGAVVAHEVGLREVDRVVQHMIGRNLEGVFPRTRQPSETVVLEVSNVTSSVLRDVSVTLHRGEIVCIAGLVGSGRTELLRAIFGLDSFDTGKIQLHGAKFIPGSPSRAIQKGMGIVTEDRKSQGLVLEMSVGQNILLGNERQVASLGLMSAPREAKVVQSAVASLQIKTSSSEVEVGTLSGGNQQKVVLGRWLARSTSVLLIDEPTVGIDVGAKAEFYRLLDEYAAAGGSCLVVSSELSEVLGLADRALVMRNGTITAKLEGYEMTRESLLRAMTGGTA